MTTGARLPTGRKFEHVPERGVQLQRQYRTVETGGATGRPGSGPTDRQEAQRDRQEDRQMLSQVDATNRGKHSKLRPRGWLGVLSFRPLTHSLYELGGQMAANRSMAIEGLNVLLFWRVCVACVVCTYMCVCST